MMRLFGTWLFVAIVAGAQQEPPLPQDSPKNEEPTFRSDTRLVILPVSVADRNGNLVTALPRESFKVYENGVEQPIKVFRREDVPVSIGIVVDNSASMRNKREKVKTAALDLVRASNPGDEVFIVNFNDEAFIDTEFTNDAKLLEQGLAQIDASGGTAMRDALTLSIGYLTGKATKDKKVLLAITDGNDTASTGSLEKLVDRARQSEILIYAIGLLNEEEKGEAKKAKRDLNAITRESGGLAFYPRELNDVDKIALQVAQEIRNQYTIAYSPVNQALDGSFRQVKVIVNAEGRPAVRTRTGYYATPDKPIRKTAANLH